MDNRDVFLVRILASFIIATAVFVGFFALAYSISYHGYQLLSHENTALNVTISEFDGVLAHFSCDNKKLLMVSQEFDNAADKLTLIEKRFGKRDERVLAQKQIYSELEYRHFLIVQRFNTECNSTYVPVLFFYSNFDEDEDESSRMGFILTTFEHEDPGRVMIYSFDYHLDSPVIAHLIEAYNVTSIPSVSVNFSRPFYLHNLDELEQYV